MVLLHFTLLILTSISFGIMATLTYNVSDESKKFGSLLILFPAFMTGLIYLFLVDSFNEFKDFKVALNYWWLFLLYSPLVWLSNWFRTRGLFYNNFTSTSILINSSIVFSLFIESYIFENKFSTSVILGVSLLFIAAYLTHNGKVPFNKFSWFIIAHCLLASINRNIDFYLLNDGVNIFSILLFQEILIIPLVLILSWSNIKDSLHVPFQDKNALYAMISACVAIPLSLSVASLYGPSETLLAISSGWLISSIIANSKTLNISTRRILIIVSMSFISVYLMVN